MSINSSTVRVRLRRSTKSKSKQAETAAAAENAATATQQNEKLQRYVLSDKLDALIQQQQQQQQQQQHQHQQQQQQFNITTRSTTPLFNNGIATVVNCCRDINCHLNSPNNTARGGDEQQQLAACSSVKRERQNSSGSRLSRCSIFSLASALSNSISTKSSRHSDTSLSTTHSLVPNGGISDAASGDLLRPPVPVTPTQSQFIVQLNLDLLAWLLFAAAFCTRFYKLAAPSSVVFDEIHYGKYISLYMRNIFFFDQHPPLGKQVIAAVANIAGYDGNFTFPRIGAKYTPNVPIFWLRFVPALCGSLLAPAVYKLLLQARLNRWSSLLGGVLIILDNALLTQSRFVLMESMLLLFSTLGIYYLLKFQRSRFGGLMWLVSGVASASFLTFAVTIKYVGFLSTCLAVYLMCRYFWDLLYNAYLSDLQIAARTVGQIVIFTVIPVFLYVGIFYLHFQTLYRAGPHDSAMTSAFQASLDGGLASITRGQPLKVVHGSQITLRNTHGRTCWLHSHDRVYPVRYQDKRGSSHQQQVTCYSFKDVNNWWIVKRPEREDLVVGEDLDMIRHGDIIQLVHGITSRGLNSHDVAAPMTPQCQEVSCYIDYEINMEGELLWRVEILNKNTEGPIWHAIKSEVRLIHKSTGAALRFSGRQLPDWGFNQHEIVADRNTNHRDAIWNVEEHRYTKTQNQRERERQLLSAEMIPMKKTKLSFWQKFIELQAKMLWHGKHLQSHMYSSEPLEWPLLDKGIAYWVESTSNSQIHLLGNVLIWYSGTLALLVYALLGVFYVLRRHREHYDLPPYEWQQFVDTGDVFFIGYLIHYLPYFFMDRTLFLHNYLPAFLFKLLLLCYVLEHLDYLIKRYVGNAFWYRLVVLLWIAAVAFVYYKFLPLSYGLQKLNAAKLSNLRWKDTWDFILQKDYALT